LDDETDGLTLSGQDENIVKVEMDDKLKQFIVNGRKINVDGESIGNYTEESTLTD
jgi:hypothetical protein